MTIRGIAYLLIIFSVVSCGAQDKSEIVESATAFDLTQAQAAIKQSSLTLTKAFEKKDTETIANAYTKNASILASGHNALTSDSILPYISKLLSSNVKSVSIKSEGIWGDSSLLAQEGTYTLEGKDRTRLDKGKFILLWKMESGNWKIYRQMWTSDLPQNKIVTGDQ